LLAPLQIFSVAPTAAGASSSASAPAPPLIAPQPERWGGISRRFVDDMRAFHAEPNAMKRDEIAARQLHALRACQEKASPT
jgi:hypothetical protein